jgi:hypothetical protein
MKFFVCVLFIGLFCATSHGKSIEGLYDAKIMVSDQTVASRKLGAQDGLLEVLQRVSGGVAPLDNNVIIKALGIADQYLYQYSYATITDNVYAQAPAGSKWLNMRFEGKGIQRLIKAAELPRWGKNRPSVMVWLAVDDNGERAVVGDDSVHLARQSLTDGAMKRGLPLVLPLNDLEDSIKLPVEQLWGLYSDPIKAASVRYGAESVLAARLFKGTQGEWKGQWRFFFDGQMHNYVFETPTLDAQILAGLTSSAQVLSAKYALKPSRIVGNHLNIEVDLVGSLGDYASLTRYLDKLAITKGVAIKGLEGKKISIDLALNGSLEQFKQTLRLDRKLVLTVLTKIEEDVVDEESPIRFQWVP